MNVNGLAILTPGVSVIYVARVLTFWFHSCALVPKKRLTMIHQHPLEKWGDETCKLLYGCLLSAE